MPRDTGPDPGKHPSAHSEDQLHDHDCTTATECHGPSEPIPAPGARKAARRRDGKMDCSNENLTVTMLTGRRGFNEKSMASRIKAVQRRAL